MNAEALLLSLLVTPPAPPSLVPFGLPAAPAAACPADMRLVEGVHNEFVQRLCTDFHHGQCWRFAPDWVAHEGRSTPVRTCMDRFEWPNRQGEAPVVMLRFTEAEAACEGVGKRLCTEFEWEVACEGPEQRPWPYGWARQPACNNDRPYRPISESKIGSSSAAVREAETRRLWQGDPSGSFPGCESAHGIVDLVGNVEEWVVTSRPEWPYRSGLKGGYWSKPWSGCRGTNESHGPSFRFYEIGFRCCQSP